LPFVGDWLTNTNLSQPFTKDELISAQRYWWIHSGIIPAAWCDTVDVMDHHPWWLHDKQQLEAISI
jgi:hypothetical protein